MGCFNRNDLIGYRHWLHRGARMGDADARRELGWFDSRLTHSNARQIRRLRPIQRRDGYAWRSEPLPVLKRG